MSEMFVFGLPLPPVDPSATIGDFSRSTISEVSGAFSQAQIEEFARDAVANALVAGANITVAVNDAGNTITISSTGGSGGGFTQSEIEEFARDAIAAALVAGTNVTITPNDAGNTITIAASGGAGGGLTLEEVQDAVAAMIVAGTNVTATYNDAAGTLTLSSSSGTGGGLTEAEVQEIARDALGAALVAGSNVTITPNDAANTITISATGGAGGGLTEEQIQDLVAAMIVAGTNVTATYNDAAGTLTLASTASGGSSALESAFPVLFGKPVSSESQALSNAGRATSLRFPYGFQLNEVRAFCTVAPTTSNVVIDIHSDSPNASILGDRITIPVGATTSKAALVQPTIATAIVPDDGFYHIEVDTTDPGVRGLFVWFIGQREVLATPTVPGVPTSLTVTPGNASNSLSWAAALGASLPYVVQFSTNGGSTWQDVSGETTATSFIHSGLTNGTAYTYRVAAVNAQGQGPFSATASGTPRTVPQPPTGLTAGSASEGSVPLSWVAPTNNGGSPVTDYAVQFKLTSEPTNWTTFSDLVSTNTSVTVNGLNAGTSYDFRVASINAAGTGTFTAPITASTTNAGSNPPDAPGPVIVVGDGTLVDGAAVLAWNPPASGPTPTSYTLRYRYANGVLADGTTEAWTTIANIPTSEASGYSFSVPNLPTASHNFQVAGVNAAGTGAWSSSSSISHTRTAPLATPTVTATPGDGQVSLSWGAVAGATEYLIYHSLSGTGPWALLATQAGTTFTHTGRTNGVLQRYRVHARSANNSSVNGNATATPAAGGGSVPAQPTISSASAFDLNIDASYSFAGGGGTPTSMELQYAAASAPTTYSNTLTSSDVTSPTTFGAFSGNIALIAGTQYVVRVRGVNAAGAGAWSANSAPFTYSES